MVDVAETMGEFGHVETFFRRLKRPMTSDDLNGGVATGSGARGYGFRSEK